MAGREHRRVANQPGGPMTRAEWEQLRRTLLALVSQYRAADPGGWYTLRVEVVERATARTPV